jgi:DnaK suppressor protein
MDDERAADLLRAERSRIEAALESVHSGTRQDAEDREPGELGSEELLQSELDEGRHQDLHDQLSAVERAEARLAAGTYGLSVESGEPIPDGRLEAMPTAERTVAEQERLGP